MKPRNLKRPAKTGARPLLPAGGIVHLYETEHKDFELTPEEEAIMKAMRGVDKLWKAYKRKPGGNKLILFAGGTGCEMRYETPSKENSICSFDNITCDGGDGGDAF